MATNRMAKSNANLPNVITSSTSIGHVLTSLVMLMCRKITTKLPVRNRLLAYLAIIFFGGIINDFAPVLIRSVIFKIDKKNILNQWGVKIGWFWTCALLAPFMLLTGLVVKINNLQSHEEQREIDHIIKRIKLKKDYYGHLQLALVGLKTIDFLRLVLNTLAWYLSVNFYNFIEALTSNCVDQSKNVVLSSISSRDHCTRAGHRFVTGFDISGHTFLLLFANLLIISESRIMIGWENLESSLEVTNLQDNNRSKTKDGISLRGDLPSKSRLNQAHSNRISQPDRKMGIAQSNQNAIYLYRKFATPIRIMFIFLTVLCVVWDFMLIQTALFYHTMIQKLIAALWATAVWYILYYHLYKYVLRRPLPAKQLLDNPKSLGGWGV